MGRNVEKFPILFIVINTLKTKSFLNIYLISAPPTPKKIKNLVYKLFLKNYVL